MCIRDRRIIKRVIATEGQTVDIDFERGVVLVDGQELDESAYIENGITIDGADMQFPQMCIRDSMADSRALEIAVSVYQACHFIGMPECSVHLTHAVVYFSLAPKSNSLYMAYESAKKDAQNMRAEPVPLQIRNAPTKLMKELHYGEGYQYAHDTEAVSYTHLRINAESI